MDADNKAIFKRRYKSKKKDVGRLSSKLGYLFNEADNFISAQDATETMYPGDIGEAIAVANELMAYGAKYGEPYPALRGAEIYEKIGKGNIPSVRRKLLSALKHDTQRGKYNNKARYEDEVQQFLDRNHPSKLESLNSGSLVLSVLGIIGGIFLIYSSLNSNIQLSPGVSAFNWKLWLGIVLFLIGIVGGYFWFKRKKFNI